MRDEKGGVHSLSVSDVNVKSLILVEFPLPTVGNLRALASGKPKWSALGIDCQKR